MSKSPFTVRVFGVPGYSSPWEVIEGGATWDRMDSVDKICLNEDGRILRYPLNRTVIVHHREIDDSREWRMLCCEARKADGESDTEAMILGFRYRLNTEAPFGDWVHTDTAEIISVRSINDVLEGDPSPQLWRHDLTGHVSLLTSNEGAAR